ncbi:MAG: NAD(P)H-dependent oxidoreductase subunit E [Candidatus Zixiibacteriota bacterium]|nr:MAG: NAD(P)H-dependent oxidoreductase subunit E [candidate division Zixibacteria bacterium]
MTSQKILSEESIKELKRLEDLYPEKKSIVLMVLHAIYDQFGYIKPDAVDEAAEIVGVPPLDFFQAASFYTFFPREKVGRYHIQVCRTLSCYLRGSEELVEYLIEKLNIKMGGITEDGLFSLTEVECLGSCGTAPMMQINDTYYENLDRAKVDSILNELRKKAKSG